MAAYWRAFKAVVMVGLGMAGYSGMERGVAWGDAAAGVGSTGLANVSPRDLGIVKMRTTYLARQTM